MAYSSVRACLCMTRCTSTRRSFLTYYGFDTIPEATEYMTYARALVAATNGDGVVSDKERTWIIGYCSSLGFPAEAMAFLESNTPVDFKELLSELESKPLVKLGARLIIFDAIRACSADGYVPGERVTVHKLAEALEVPPEVVTALVCAQKCALQVLFHTLRFPSVPRRKRWRRRRSC